MTTPNNAAALLPCPFCGSMPKSGWQGTGVPGMEDCGYWGIDCCNAFAHAGSENDAASQWNRRAITKTSPHELLGVAYKEQGISGVVDFHRPATNTLRDAITSQPSGEAVDREEVLRDYVADYEFLGETEDGRDACYQPNERERLLIEDAIRGWIAFDLPSDHPSADAPGVTVDEWRPIETAPKEAPYWVVWSAYYQRPVVVTQRSNDNTYWEGDWDFDVQATHWTAALAPKPEGE